MQLKGKIRCWFEWVILFVIITPLNAQNDNRISCVAFVREDSIILRWVPASVPVWQSGIEHGYIIKRYTIAKDGEFIQDGLAKGKLLTASPVVPATSEYFDWLADSDSRASVVQEAVYSPDIIHTNGNFDSFIEAYEDLEVRFGFALFMCDMSPVIADAAGLLFSDTEIHEGERYVYSISLANTPDDLQVEPAVIVVDADELTQLPPVTDIQSIFLDKAVRFRWPVTFFKGIYSAYIIEKSLDQKNFKPVSELPLVNFSQDENPDYFIYTDSLKSNNQQVSYIIKGISPFGETGPASEIVTGKGIPDFSSYASIDTAAVIENSRILINWRIPETEASSVSAINILRSDAYNGPFVQVNRKPLNSKTRTFTDENPSLSNYYQVMLEGKNNLKSYSFPYFVQTEDNEPPKAPQDLSGSVDSTGLVTIAWKSNSEPDLIGYKVFRANSAEEEFIALDRDINDQNFCLDSINLNTLSQIICYRVVAMDRNYNSSDYSQALVLSRPDTIPPAPAVFTRIEYSSGRVTHTMEESPSVDVASYELYMQAEKDTSEILVRSWEKLPRTYQEQPSAMGALEYRLVTMDKRGNRSDDHHKIYIHDTRERTFTLTADQTPDGRRIILKWEIPEDIRPLKTVIYRGDGNNAPGIYATIGGMMSSYEDGNTEINTSYSYRIILYGESEAVSSGKFLFTPGTRNK